MLRTDNRDLHRLHDAKGRFYVFKDHPKRASITSIISAGVPKPALMYWGIKMVAEYVAGNLNQIQEMEKFGTPALIKHLKSVPWESRDTAADVGTTLHDYAEAYVLHGPPPEPEDPTVAAMAVQYRDWLDTMKPVFRAAELIVHNQEEGYAGTIDGVVELQGIPGIMDYKTGKGVYGEAAMQLAAGAHCDMAVVDRSTATDTADLFDGVECGYTVHIRPDSWAVYTSELVKPYAAFRYGPSIARWQWNETKSALQLMYSGGVDL